MVEISAWPERDVAIDPDQFEIVVIDAANVAHTNIRDPDSDEDLIAIFPERLEAAIEYCSENGWGVKGFLKRGTYDWAVRNSSSPTIGDVSIFDRLIKQNVVELVQMEREDIHWIDFAIKNSGLIITRDKFRKERADFPDRDWDSVEASTLRNYKVLEGGDFLLPDLPIKGDGSRTTYRGLKARVEDLESRVRELESILIGQTEFAESGVQGRGSDMPDRTTEGRYESKTVAELKELLRERSLPVSGNKAGLTARLEEADAADDYRPEHVRREPEVKVVPEGQNEAIVAEVFDRLLGEGEKRHMTVILHTLASVLLGLEYSESTKGSWPKNWRDELDRALGVEGKASYWIHDLSPRELDFSEDRSTVWYAYGVIL